MTATVRQRRYDIDALRVGAVLVGLLYHSGRAFDTEAWHIKNAVSSQWFDLMGDVLTPWRMPLLMLLAGARDVLRPGVPLRWPVHGRAPASAAGAVHFRHAGDRPTPDLPGAHRHVDAESRAARQLLRLVCRLLPSGVHDGAVPDGWRAVLASPVVRAVSAGLLNRPLAAVCDAASARWPARRRLARRRRVDALGLRLARSGRVASDRHRALPAAALRQYACADWRLGQSGSPQPGLRLRLRADRQRAIRPGARAWSTVDRPRNGGVHARVPRRLESERAPTLAVGATHTGRVGRDAGRPRLRPPSPVSTQPRCGLGERDCLSLLYLAPDRDRGHCLLRGAVGHVRAREVPGRPGALSVGHHRWL